MGLDCLEKFKTGKKDASQNFTAGNGPRGCPVQPSCFVVKKFPARDITEYIQALS